MTGERLRDVWPLRLISRMQPVPPLDVQRVPPQLVVAGDAPHVGLHTVLVRKLGLRAQRFVQNGPAAEKMHLRRAIRGRLETVNTAQNTVLGSGRHGRLGVVFVVDSDVVEAIFAVLVHAADAVAHNYRDLVGIGGIVAVAGGHRAGRQLAVPVLVLQALAGERRPSSGSAYQEAFAA